MKINRSNIESLYSRTITDASDKRTGSGTNVSIDKKTESDKIQISDKAREYTAGKCFANNVVKEATEPTRSEKLMKLKNDIASGNYFVSSDKIAAAILRKLK
jgi:anti-sigma28 factor (negative regulator of flagellin synthesis)